MARIATPVVNKSAFGKFSGLNDTVCRLLFSDEFGGRFIAAVSRATKWRNLSNLASAIITPWKLGNFLPG